MKSLHSIPQEKNDWITISINNRNITNNLLLTNNNILSFRNFDASLDAFSVRDLYQELQDTPASFTYTFTEY